MSAGTPKHTPGPWSVDITEGDVTGPHMVHVALVTRIDDLPCVDGDERPDVEAECLANARLVAAAPELLEALRGMLAMQEMLWKSVPWAKTYDLDVKLLNEAPIAARIAIAKAEGRS